MSIDGLSPRGRQLAGSIARTLELLREHDKLSLSEVDQLLAFMVAHIRAWRPQVLLALEEMP